jgi:hypothetical protein
VCDDGEAMRGCLPRSWSGFVAVSVLSACSTIIGVSDHEIDPSLDVAGKASAGGDDSGDKGPVIEAGAGGGDTGGKGTVGGTAGKGGVASTGGMVGTSGTAGMGGEPIGGCQVAGDCDDTIDCTTDTCSASHECVHTPKNSACDASSCETCQAGIGCVAGVKKTTQLLADPNFDLDDASWDESGSDGFNVVTVADAQTGTKVAQFGPGDITAEAEQYSDLFQWVTIPEGTVALTLAGYYKLTPGTFKPAEDYVVAAFYEDGETEPFTQFHSFKATAAAQAAWKTFSYNAPTADVLKMGGTEYTFDLVAHVWDTVFQLDSLQLNATVCQ